MLRSKMYKLPLGDIKPAGWLKQQLKVQAEGLSGHVMELFRDLSPSSAWLGGKGECWERGPYYIDGLLPLAFLLEDETLIEKAMIWINSIIGSQDEEGFFGPKKNLDWWPRMVVNKMLPSYFEVSCDPRVPSFLLRYYSYMAKTIEKRPFHSWGKVRACEELVGIRWTYLQTGEAFLLELADKILKSSFDWTNEFSNFRWANPSRDYLSKKKFNIKKVAFYAPDFIQNMFGTKGFSLQKREKREASTFNQFYHVTHGVNLAMALKYPVYQGLFQDKPKNFGVSEYGMRTLLEKNGTSIGIFTCDEHLSGFEGYQGIELCTVVEMMFSAEKLYELTGNKIWADRLENYAFNALPATFTKDMCAHQYVQQPNQVSATIAKRDWYDSYRKANIFGLKPNYPCCLSNMHQGFPKFAEHLAFKKENTLVILAPIACDISTRLKDEEVSIAISSNYPFTPEANIKVEKGVFDIAIRIPTFCNYLLINGDKYTEDIKLAVKTGDTLHLSYDYQLRVSQNEDSSISYYYGPFLLALPIEGDVRMKKNNRFSDREIYPLSEWRYALPLNPSNYEYVSLESDKYFPFGRPNFGIKVPAKRVDWNIKNNSCDKVGNVKVDVLAPDEEIILVPYGFTDLRISQFPWFFN